MHAAAPRPRRARARGTWALGLVLAVAACGADDAPADAGSDDVHEPDPDDEPFAPLFSEPASGRLALSTTRTDDVVLEVKGVVPGRTSLVLDGQSLGPLGEEGSSVGALVDGALVLHVRGALVEGTHRMQLRNADPDALVESDAVEISLIAEVDASPTAGPLTASGLPAQRLLALGEGRDALLVALEADATGVRLHLVPRGDAGWDVDGARTVAAPGLEPSAGERVLPVAALRYDRTDDDDGRVRVAYRVGAPGTSVALLDAAWDDAAAASPRVDALSLEAALGGRAAEWAELGRPWLAADLLVAELWAPLDVESPRPGDRALVWSRVQALGAAIDPPQRVVVRADLVDLDQLGPAVDPVAAAAGAPPIVGVRIAHHQPLVLEPDPTGGLRPRPTVLPDTDRTFAFVDLPLATVVGAFGSRTVAGVTAAASGRLRLARLDDLGDGGIEPTTLGPDDLPPLDQVTGELAPGVVGGLAVFLVPYGAEQPVHALHSDGAAIRITPLPDLRCDAVALAPPDPHDPAAVEVPLACALDGEAWLGALSVASAP